MSEIRFIVDSSTLSNFARAGYLNLLKTIFHAGLLTTSDVIEEIERGSEKDPELRMVLNELNLWLKVVDELTEEEQSLIRNLRITHEEFEDGADASLLAVAKERSLVLITDDKYLKKVAEQEGVKVDGTVEILEEAINRGLIRSEEELNQIARDMEHRARFRLKDSDLKRLGLSLDLL
ncbi:PIN domain-containing protein [Thermocrinis ruber]|uniref:PIN domain-containing protein n=1 Tax=Thermocrinis ruber TaxID=75906 RepID=UPI0012EC403F|nr:PIN domain-containing protein [Thermocrinis ruber]